MSSRLFSGARGTTSRWMRSKFRRLCSSVYVCCAGRQRFEKTVAAAAGVTRDAPRISLPGAGQYRLHAGLEYVVIQAGLEVRHGSRAHPRRQRPPLRIVLRHPVLSPTVPVAAPGLFSQRIGQQKALQRFSGNHDALNALEIPARLFVGIDGRAWRQRLEEAVAAATGVARDAAGVPFARACEYREDTSLEDLEVEARLRCGRGSLLRMHRRPRRKEKRQDDQRRF